MVGTVRSREEVIRLEGREEMRPGRDGAEKIQGSNCQLKVPGKSLYLSDPLFLQLIKGW